jgi:hypothetical protein
MMTMMMMMLMMMVMMMHKKVSLSIAADDACQVTWCRMQRRCW